MSPKRLCPSFAEFQGGVEQVPLVPAGELCRQRFSLRLPAANSKSAQSPNKDGTIKAGVNRTWRKGGEKERNGKPRVIFALACGVLGMTLLALFFCVVGMVFFPFATPNIAFIATVLLGFVIVAFAGWLSTSKELWQD